MENKKSLKLNMLLNAIKNLLAIIFPLISFPYVSKTLGVEALGQYNFAASLITYIDLIAGLPLEGYNSFVEGFNSVAFAVAAILAGVVMNDAVGVRREAGKHATSILQIVESLNGLMDEDEHIRTEKLKELVGHTPLQAFFGVLLGWCVVAVYCILAKNGYMFGLL